MVLVFLLIIVVLCSFSSPWSCPPSCHGFGVPFGCTVVLCSSQLSWSWCSSQLLWSCAPPNHQGLMFLLIIKVCVHSYNGLVFSWSCVPFDCLGLVLLLIIMILCSFWSPWSCIPPNHHDLVFYNSLNYIHLLLCLRFLYYDHYQCI